MLSALPLTNGKGSVPSPIDREAVLDRVGGDEALLQEITSIFLDEYPVLLDDIRNAIAAGNALALERAAHGLKGSVSNFGAEEATAAALDLEQIGRRSKMQEATAALHRLNLAFLRLHPALVELISR